MYYLQKKVEKFIWNDLGEINARLRFLKCLVHLFRKINTVNDRSNKPNFDRRFNLLCWSVYNIDQHKQMTIHLIFFHRITLLYWYFTISIFDYILFLLQLIVLSVLVCASAAHKSMDCHDSHTVELPVESYHGVKVIPSPSHTEKHKTQVVVGASDLPVYVTFNSRSSPVYIKQNHEGTRGTFHKSQSKDEPHRMVHEVIKPV